MRTKILLISPQRLRVYSNTHIWPLYSKLLTVAIQLWGRWLSLELERYIIILCITPAGSPHGLLSVLLALILSHLICGAVGRKYWLFCIHLRLAPSIKTMLFFKRSNAGYYLKTPDKERPPHPSNPASDNVNAPTEDSAME